MPLPLTIRLHADGTLDEVVGGLLARDHDRWRVDQRLAAVVSADRRGVRGERWGCEGGELDAHSTAT